LTPPVRTIVEYYWLKNHQEKYQWTSILDENFLARSLRLLDCYQDSNFSLNSRQQVHRRRVPARMYLHPRVANITSWMASIIFQGLAQNDGYPKEDHVLVTDPFEKHVTRTMDALKEISGACRQHHGRHHSASGFSLPAAR
jgi:hypothetical protein